MIAYELLKVHTKTLVHTKHLTELDLRKHSGMCLSFMLIVAFAKLYTRETIAIVSLCNTKIDKGTTVLKIFIRGGITSDIWSEI